MSDLIIIILDLIIISKLNRIKCNFTKCEANKVLFFGRTGDDKPF